MTTTTSRCPSGSARSPILWFWSVKGGSGTSTVSASVAIRLADNDREVVLVDLAGDQPALLGVIADGNADTAGISDWMVSDMDCGSLDALAEELVPGLRLLRQGTRSVADLGDTPADDSRRRRLITAVEALAHPDRVVVVDAGLDPHEHRSAVPAVPVCIIRNCYLALRRAQCLPGPYDRIVVVEEPQRALSVRNVADALGADKIESIAWDQQIARAVDAGTIVSMLPPPLTSGLDTVMGLAVGRVARDQ